MEELFKSVLPNKHSCVKYVKQLNCLIWNHGQYVLMSDVLFINIQKLYQHKENILSLDINEELGLIATGEEGIESDIFLYSIKQVNKYHLNIFNLLE